MRKVNTDVLNTARVHLSRKVIRDILDVAWTTSKITWNYLRTWNYLGTISRWRKARRVTTVAGDREGRICSRCLDYVWALLVQILAIGRITETFGHVWILTSSKSSSLVAHILPLRRSSQRITLYRWLVRFALTRLSVRASIPVMTDE